MHHHDFLRGAGRALAVATIATAGLAASAAAETVTVGVRGGPEGLDPHYSPLGTHVSAMRNIYETLVTRDDNLQIQPGLATEWKPLSDLVWEFKLRPDVKFHDGSAFTAEDFKCSAERIPHISGVAGGLQAYAKRIKEVEVMDDLTFKIHTDSPAATLPLDLARVFIIPCELEDQEPQAFNSGDGAIGTGPFKVESWEPKGDLILVRNDDYWGEKPPFEKVVFTEISNDSARVAALLSGRVDLINYAPPADIRKLESDPEIAVSKGPSVYNFMIYPDFRETTPQITVDGKPVDGNPLLDLKVRKALSLAINRDIIADRVMEGLATPVNQLTPHGFFGSSDDLPELGYDPEAAKALLAEAGYPDGFEVVLNCTSDRLPNDGKVCAALGQMFAKVGIETEVNAIPKAVYFPAQGRGEFSLMMNGWGSLTGEASYILSSIIHSKGDKLGALNRTGYGKPETDALIVDALGTLDDEERKAKLKKITEMTMEDMAVIPIVTLSAIWASRADKVTYAPRADEETRAINIEPAS